LEILGVFVGFGFFLSKKLWIETSQSAILPVVIYNIVCSKTRYPQLE